MFELVFLGTSAAAPSMHRGLSSAMVSYKEYRFLVDCGEGTQRQLLRSGLGFRRLDRILLTHGHIDHAAGAAELAERLSIPIDGPHAEDKIWLDNMARQAEMFDFPEGRVCQPDRWLREGDEVTFGAERLQVLHCPGHTPGHLVFYHPEEHLAQVGDVLFKGSIGRTDLPQGDYQALISSIREKLFPLGDDVRFIPGHGPMSTFGEERRSNPFVSD